jgi:hypothetical protein
MFKFSGMLGAVYWQMFTDFSETEDSSETSVTIGQYGVILQKI